MAVAASSRPRVTLDGKFFRLGENKFYVKGVAYGPFAPNAAGQSFASPEQTIRDLAQIRELGANLLRVYQVPAKWFLDVAAEKGLKVLIDIPWNKHLCFLDSKAAQANALDCVKRAVFGVAGHPSVFAWSVANEIPTDIVRWSGAAAVADFIDELVQQAKKVDPDCLCTFTNFPPTEFLRPQGLDFLCFNVYLHQENALKNYLARLQMQAESKPLILGEFGVDSRREGESAKCHMLDWQIETIFRAGLAGGIVFSFTDDWWCGGKKVTDWNMGLTTGDRIPKPSFGSVQKKFAIAPHFALPQSPRVSIVVASYNAERTLKACLESLVHLNYSDYEVILVDDGSTDSTPKIALSCPQVRYFRHEKNLGLSVARNTGIAASTGEIIAFTDADCRADENWLYYLVGALVNSEFSGMGGPNLLPPDDSAMAAAVMASPGGPAHVMFTDRQAEHIPGCNMAFYRWALAEIGGFDPIFHKAGDDVDICWRLQQSGNKIGFSPAAFVWHYRRANIRAYLTQQHGYGEAEALLVRKHPECFNSLGSSIWQGRIYAPSQFGLLLGRPIIYRGLFGTAGFQGLYATPPTQSLMLATSLEYHVLINLPLWVLSVVVHSLLPLAVCSLLLSVVICLAAGFQAPLPKSKTRWWSRPLIALLFFLQPVVRGYARYQGRLLFLPKPFASRQSLDSLALRDSAHSLSVVEYWSEKRLDRIALVTDMLSQLEQSGWPHKPDIGWSEYDAEIYDTRWTRLQITAVVEEHPQGKQLIRWRLRPHWALRAKVAFWTLFAMQLLVLGFLGTWIPWLWLLLLTLPIFAWYLRRQERNLQSLIAVCLDALATKWNLAKVFQESEA